MERPQQGWEELDWTSPGDGGHPRARVVRSRWQTMAYVLLPQPPARAWAFIHPAENSSLDPGVLRAYRDPATPTGLGERQTFEYRGGGVHTIEVVELVPGRCAVTAPVVEGRVAIWTGQTIQTVDPAGAGCRLGLGHRLPPGARHRERLPRRGPLKRQLLLIAASLARWDGAQP